MGLSSVSNGVVVAVIVVAVGLAVYPDPVAEYLRAQKQEAKNSFWSLENVLRIVHLASFSSTFGTQFWLSFVGGVVMFKHLPRHQFGNLQSHMFPVYFKLAAVALATNISILSVLLPVISTPWEKLQIGALELSLLFTLINLLVLEPITTKLMRERHKAEKEDGISTEPGVNRKAEIEKASPKLKAVNKKFGAAHGISSLINLFAFWGLLVHGTYLASRLSL